MSPVRQDILDYLAPGQASVSALVEATGHRPVEIRAELESMLSENLITSERIDCPRFKVTVYRLA